MESSVLYLLLGAGITGIFTFIHYFLDKDKEKKKQLKQLKIEVYTKVLSEISGHFIQFEDLIILDSDDTRKVENFEMTYWHKSSNIIAPAKLIASDELRKCLDDLIKKENKYLSWLIRQGDKDYDDDLETEKIIKLKSSVLTLMRKEIYS